MDSGMDSGLDYWNTGLDYWNTGLDCTCVNKWGGGRGVGGVEVGENGHMTNLKYGQCCYHGY